MNLALPSLGLGSQAAPTNRPARVDLLILGAGGTASFLIPHLRQYHPTITFAATTRSGGGPFSAIPFNFEPSEEHQDEAAWKTLPDATTVLVTFPIKVAGGSTRLAEWYGKTRKTLEKAQMIQLGSTGIYDGGPTLRGMDVKGPPSKWFDRHSPFDMSNPRASSETEFIRLTDSASLPLPTATTVLNLSGLYGGERSMRNYVSKVAPSKEALRNKGSLHMIHGLDVSRAVLAVHLAFDRAAGQRWLLTDGRIYDWWDLASAWGAGGEKTRDAQETIGDQAAWVRELMQEQGLRALPRIPDMLDRCLDSREFWQTFGLSPVRARLELQ